MEIPGCRVSQVEEGNAPVENRVEQDFQAQGPEEQTNVPGISERLYRSMR